MLSGYKTYITAGVAIVGYVAAYLTGDATLPQMAQAVLTALLGINLRHAVAKL